MKRSIAAGNRPLAFHLLKRAVTPLAPVRGRASRLPRRLVIPPGRYRIHGRTYELGAEGLYRFIFPTKGDQQRIVYQKRPLALVSALCWLQTHGSRDNPRSHRELAGQALTSKLVCTCGRICAFARSILERQGIPSRRVFVRTLEEPNGYDDGHVLLEVFLGRRWILFDVDMHVAFVRRGKRLSLVDLLPGVPRGAYGIEWLSGSIRLAIGAFEEGGYDYSLWAESAFHSEGSLRRWHRRVMMVPMLFEGNRRYFTARTPSDRRRARRLYPEACENFLPWTEFRRRFYRDPTNPSR